MIILEFTIRFIVLKGIPKYPSNVHSRMTSNSTAYYTFHTTPSTWYEAQVACKKENPYSHLVSIKSSEEQAYIVKVIKLSEGEVVF